MTEKKTYPTVNVAQLKVGIFVHIDLKWSQHPFMTSSFKIKNAAQIDVIHGLGLTTIHYDPSRSDVQPGKPSEPSASAPLKPRELDAAQLAVIEAKKVRTEQLAKQWRAVEQCEKKFVKAATTLKEINVNLFSKPQKSLVAAGELVSHMVDSILLDKDMALQVISNKGGKEEVYFHSLNVAVLSMILGKEMKCTRQEITYMGLGAIFHDVGKNKIPDKILKKTGPLTRHERSFYEQHPIYSEEIVKSLKLPSEILQIARCHHEAINGSGYPDGVDGSQMNILTKIIVIANTFDNYCNMTNAADSLTPYEALSRMYAKERGQFDAGVLPVFIRAMGVYPPGTIVRLSNDMLGLVISVNSSKPLKPNVLVYDPDIPKDEAVIINMEQETEINIVKTLRPSQLSREVYAYLNPRKRVTYYFDEATDQDVEKKI